MEALGFPVHRLPTGSHSISEVDEDVWAVSQFAGLPGGAQCDCTGSVAWAGGGGGGIVCVHPTLYAESGKKGVTKCSLNDC